MKKLREWLFPYTLDDWELLVRELFFSVLFSIVLASVVIFCIWRFYEIS